MTRTCFTFLIWNWKLFFLFCCRHCSRHLLHNPKHQCTKLLTESTVDLVTSCFFRRQTWWAEGGWNFLFNVGEFAEACDLIHSWSGRLWLPVGFGPAWMFYRQKHTAALDIISNSSAETHPRLNIVNQWNVSTALHYSQRLHVQFPPYLNCLQLFGGHCRPIAVPVWASAFCPCEWEFCFVCRPSNIVCLFISSICPLKVKSCETF